MFGNDSRTALITAEIKKNDRVLNLGCAHHNVENAISRGIWLHAELAKVTENLLGLDLIEAEVKRITKLGFKAVCANVESMDLDETFDVIVAGEIIEHLSNPGLFLDNSMKHLVDTGKLIISTPYPWSFICFVGKIINYLPINEEHTSWYDPVTIKQLLKRHGFSIVKQQLLPLTEGATGWRISKLLCDVGFERIGASGLLLVCKKLTDYVDLSV